MRNSDESVQIFHPPGVIRVVTPAEHAQSGAHDLRASPPPNPPLTVGSDVGPLNELAAVLPHPGRLRQRLRTLLLPMLALTLTGCAAVSAEAGRGVEPKGAFDTQSGKVVHLGAVHFARLEEMLVGRIPALEVTKRGDGRYTLRVRGVPVTGVGEPLLVVDGMPIGLGAENASAGFSVSEFLATIAPADVQRVSLIRDVAGTAIYGTRAANGVLLITTRRTLKESP